MNNNNIKENIAIRIFNYNPFNLSVNSNISSRSLNPCYEYKNPTSDTISFSELVYINSNSSAIRNGLVRFAKEQEKEIYEALAINWEDIVKNEDIEDIILNPNKNKIQKLISIKDPSVFDRVLAVYQGLISTGEYDISNRICDIIKRRSKEFRKGQIVTGIQVKAINTTSQDKDIEEIKTQNVLLQKQLNQMQEMMDKLLKNQSVLKPRATTGTKKKAPTSK